MKKIMIISAINFTNNKIKIIKMTICNKVMFLKNQIIILKKKSQ